MTIPPDVVEIDGTWVSPSGIVEYLRGHGWLSRGGRDGVYVRYSAPEDREERCNLLIPLNPRNADFRELLEDAIAGLAIETGLGSRLLLELDQGVGDTVRFRK